MSATGQATEAPSDAARRSGPRRLRPARPHLARRGRAPDRRHRPGSAASPSWGSAGFVLKSHYNSTAERAAVVREAVPGVDVLGAIVLNRAVGGINPVAVEIAAREGARKVWLPTVDSENERAHLAAAGPDTKLPVWSKLEFELREKGIGADPVAVFDSDGELLPETRDVLALAAEHGMVLSTGHISASRGAHRRRSRPRGGRRERGPHPPRLSRPGDLDRRAGRARPQGRDDRALLHDARIRASAAGSSGSRGPAPSGPSAPSSPATSAR